MTIHLLHDNEEKLLFFFFPPFAFLRVVGLPDDLKGPNSFWELFGVLIRDILEFLKSCLLETYVSALSFCYFQKQDNGWYLI